MLKTIKTKAFVILMAFALAFTLAPMSLGTAYAVTVYDGYYEFIDLSSEAGNADFLDKNANRTKAFIEALEKSGAITATSKGDNVVYYDIDKDGSVDMRMVTDFYGVYIWVLFWREKTNSIKGGIEFQLDEETLNYFRNLPEDNEEGISSICNKLYIRFDETGIENPNNPNPDYLEGRDLVVDMRKGTKTFTGADAAAVDYFISRLSFDDEIILFYDEKLSTKDKYVLFFDLDMEGTMDIKAEFEYSRNPDYSYMITWGKLQWLKDSNITTNVILTLSESSFKKCSKMEKGDMGLEYFYQSITIDTGKEETLTIKHDWAFKFDDSGNLVLTNYKNNETEVIIPDSIYGHPVTTLDSTFVNNTNIVKITVPESVTTINGAFAGCGNLEEVVFKGDKLKTIGKESFYGCSNLEKIDISKNVTSIGDWAFMGAGSSKEEFKVEFAPGSKLETIGKVAFGSCTTLKKIRIPSSVKSLGVGMLQYCYALEEVIIEPGSEVETIEESFCHNCSNLKQITIPNSVKKVCTDAFSNIYSGAEIHYIGTMEECGKIDWMEGWNGSTYILIFYESGPKYIESASLNYDGVVYYVCENPDTKGWELFLTIYKPEKFALSKTSYTYTGKALKPKVTVTDSVGKIIDSNNYKVTYANNTKVGKATATVTFKGSYYRGTKELNFTIKKAANTLKVKPLTAKVKYSALKKASMTLKRSAVLKVTGAKGKVTYKKVSGTKKITIAKTTGKVTVKKGLKKGTYKVKVKVKAAGTANYKSLTKIVTFKIKVI